MYLTTNQGNTLYHFSKLGFVGDTDDFSDDDIEKDMVENDDWMFQTFQKNGAGRG